MLRRLNWSGERFYGASIVTGFGDGWEWDASAASRCLLLWAEWKCKQAAAPGVQVVWDSGMMLVRGVMAAASSRISSVPTAGTARPTRRLRKCVERIPVNQGSVAPPSEAQ